MPPSASAGLFRSDPFKRFCFGNSLPTLDPWLRIAGVLGCRESSAELRKLARHATFQAAVALARRG